MKLTRKEPKTEQPFEIVIPLKEFCEKLGISLEDARACYRVSFSYHAYGDKDIVLEGKREMPS